MLDWLRGSFGDRRQPADAPGARRDGPRLRPPPRPGEARLGRGGVPGPLHPLVQSDLRRDAPPLPAAPPDRARDVPAADDRSERDRHLHGGRLLQPRHVQPHLHRRSSANRRRSSARTVRRPTRRRRSCRRASSRPGPDRAVSEKRRERRSSYILRMYNAITRSQLFVLDQDEALDFYVNKLGLEVSADLDLGFMRWLTVLRTRRPGPRDPAGEARPARARRRHRRAGARARLEGRDGRLVVHHDRRRPGHLRDAEGPRRRYHRRTIAQAVRHRLRDP